MSSYGRDWCRQGYRLYSVRSFSVISQPEGDPTLQVERRVRRGKDPPVDSFVGEEPETLLDDWLPSLERAALWNGWSDDECLLQLVGHLKGRALQEWHLMELESRRMFSTATDALRIRLNPDGKILAAQDFRHTSQAERERVADFIWRLGQIFKVAYGRDSMSSETRDTLLHGQLQDGLWHDIMQGPALSGAPTYKKLCLAVKNEEKRLTEL